MRAGAFAEFWLVAATAMPAPKKRRNCAWRAEGAGANHWLVHVAAALTGAGCTLLDVPATQPLRSTEVFEREQTFVCIIASLAAARSLCEPLQ